MSPRANVSVERRAQILDAAAVVFSKKGFYAASMDDLVAEAGLSKGALYWYFKSKDHVITALLDRFFAPELAQLVALQGAKGSARERILISTRVSITELKQLARRMPLTYEFYALAFRNKPAQKAMRRFFRAYADNLVPLIEQGIARGEFRNTNARQTAIALGALIEGSLLLWVFDPKFVALDKQIELGITLLLDGLGAEKLKKGK